MRNSVLFFFFERKVAAIVIRLANLELSSKSSIKAFKTLEFRIWTLQTLEFRGKMLQTLNFRVCTSHKFEFSVWAFHSFPDIIIQGFGFLTVELKVYNFQTFEFWVKPLKLRVQTSKHRYSGFRRCKHFSLWMLKTLEYGNRSSKYIIAIEGLNILNIEI